MILVFLFYFIIILNLIIVAIISLKIKVEIVKFKFSSVATPKVDPNYEINIYFYIFSKIPILKFNIVKLKVEKINRKLKIENKIQKLDLDLMKNKMNKNIFKAIKKINMKIEKIKLNIEIGTENASFTSIIVPAISTIIALYMRNKIKKLEKQTFTITPIYINQNLIKMDLSGIFEFKLIHIINMINVLTKKGEVKKYERPSNRRSYDYSYE